MTRLRLTRKELFKPFSAKLKGDEVNYFHLNIPEGAYHQADLVTFEDDDGKVYVLKNRFGEEITTNK